MTNNAISYDLFKLLNGFSLPLIGGHSSNVYLLQKSFLRVPEFMKYYNTLKENPSDSLNDDTKNRAGRICCYKNDSENYIITLCI